MNNILVVDDSPTMRRMVITSLGSLQRVKSSQAGSGLEAIERLAIEPVDLMVLDLNMPDMHGMEVIDFVRKHQAYRDGGRCSCGERSAGVSSLQRQRAVR